MNSKTIKWLLKSGNFHISNQEKMFYLNFFIQKYTEILIVLLKRNTVKLGYNEHGYNEISFITNTDK